MKITMTLILLCLPVYLPAQAETVALRLNGFADTYHAVRSKRPYDYLSSRSRLRLELNVSRGETYLFASLNAIHNQIIPEKGGIQLREAFMQHTGANWDLKAGRQIITWGVADGLRVTDLISPMDYTEFLAQDYDDIRVPVNALRLSYSGMTGKAEVVFVPVAEFFILPVADHNPWSVFSKIGIPFRLEPEATPAKKFANSEVGGRFSLFLRGLDVSISALHSWNKMPVFNQSFTAGDTLLLQPRYARMNLLGLDCAIPVRQMVVRMELAGYFGELQELDAPADPDENQRYDAFNSLIGIDWYPGGEWTLTGQYLHKRILEYQSDLSVPENTELMTCGISKKLANTLYLSMFTYFDWNNRGAFCRTSGDYALSDQIHLIAGYDWFYGDKGTFGMFRDNSEWWGKMKFSF